MVRLYMEKSYVRQVAHRFPGPVAQGLSRRPAAQGEARPACPGSWSPVALSGSARLSGSSTLACGLPVREPLGHRRTQRARRREGVRCYYVPVSEQTILTMIRCRLISLEDSFIRRRSGALSAFFRCPPPSAPANNPCAKGNAPGAGVAVRDPGDRGQRKGQRPMLDPPDDPRPARRRPAGRHRPRASRREYNLQYIV